MDVYDYILLTALVVLCTPTRTRFMALVLVFDCILYNALIVNLVGLMYYGGTATLNLLVALVLMWKEKRNRIVMYLAVLQVPINFIGWAMYESYHQPDVYNMMSLTVCTLQVLALIIGLVNARLVDDNTGLFMVRGVNSLYKKFHLKERKQKVKTQCKH